MKEDRKVKSMVPWRKGRSVFFPPSEDVRLIAFSNSDEFVRGWKAAKSANKAIQKMISGVTDE